VRLILTGSSNVLLVPRLSDSLAGRIEILRLYPLAQIELERAPPAFLNALFSDRQIFPPGRTLLGQLLETFVFGEIAKQAAAHPERIGLYHLRDKDGYEVDIVVQRGTQHVGIEVKAASSVHEADFRGIKRLRELLGVRFHGGIVLYDGDHVLPFGERLLAVPLSALWSRIPRRTAHIAD